jgi:hypothetical protein
VQLEIERVKLKFKEAALAEATRLEETKNELKLYQDELAQRE